MHLKAKDKVILPNWVSGSSKQAPIWGGPEGYQFGVIEKTLTHEHDPSKHVALVHWSNGEIASFPESALQPATPDEVDVSLDYRQQVAAFCSDIWILVRTSLGNFALNAIESEPFGRASATKFTTAVSRRSLPSVDNSDYNLVGHLVLAKDFTDSAHKSILDAAVHVFRAWELPAPLSVPLPLPEFNSVKEAAATAPDGPAVLMFHLPHTLREYAGGQNETPS